MSVAVSDRLHHVWRLENQNSNAGSITEGRPMAARNDSLLTDRFHAQCAFEADLAGQFWVTKSNERARLYNEAYDKYARVFPEHLPAESTDAERIARYETSFLSQFLRPTDVIVEIGPGRCHLAFAIAPYVTKIFGVDVSSAGSGRADVPPNYEARLTDGIHLPFETDSIDVAISIQLMEHLHPDDAVLQLQEVHRVLRKGGNYICVTPSRVNGPHDCSAYFDDMPCPVRGGDYQAIGLHLREYTILELAGLFRDTGFTRVRSWIAARGNYVELPPLVLASIESVLRVIPPSWRKRSDLLRTILGNRMCATK